MANAIREVDTQAHWCQAAVQTPCREEGNSSYVIRIRVALLPLIRASRVQNVHGQGERKGAKTLLSVVRS